MSIKKRTTMNENKTILGINFEIGNDMIKYKSHGSYFTLPSKILLYVMLSMYISIELEIFHTLH